MAEYLWAFYALGSALGASLMFLTSEHFKQGGVGFLTVIRSMTAVTLLPFALMVEWPTEPLFYIYGGLVFVLFPIADVLLFRVSAQHGAGVLTRFVPLTAIVTFLIWLLVDFETLQSYIESPVYALGIVGCLLGVVFCVSSLRSCAVSLAAFKTLLPIFVLMPLGGVFAKLAFDATSSSSAAIINLFVGSFIGVAVYGVLYKLMSSVRAEFTMTKLTIKAGVIASIFSTILIYWGNLSSDLVSNPAYANAVSFTSAIWVLVIYKVIGRKNDTRILPGVGIVVFTALLVLLSGQI